MDKTCSKCSKTKPHAEFSRAANRPDGLQCHCKACCKATRATHYAANKDKILAASARWHADNPEKVKAWHTANPEKIKAYSTKRHAEDRRKINAYNAAHKGEADERGRCACCGQPLTKEQTK